MQRLWFQLRFPCWRKQSMTLRSVTAVRHWSLPEVTRVSIRVSGDFHFTTERLHTTLSGSTSIFPVSVQISSRSASYRQFDGKFVQRIRIENHPGVTRVVLDLAGSVEATASQLTGPDRLIVE